MESSPDLLANEDRSATLKSVADNRFVSVVVIARNEESTIARCIVSAIGSLERAISKGLIVGGEVILVDSASSDRTIENAGRFPITILQLSADWPLSASAGRYVGARYARGDIFYFIDGDTVVEEDWLAIALRYLSLPDVAAVGGSARDLTARRSVLGVTIQDSLAQSTPDGEIGDAEVVNVGLFLREAYEAVGGFHPFLRGAEDLDLSFRLNRRGLRLLKTRAVVGVHHWSGGAAEVRYPEYLRSVAIWSFGSGQACRVHYRDAGLRNRFVRRYLTSRFVLSYLQGLAVIATCLAQAALGLLWPSVLPLIVLLDSIFLSFLVLGRRRGGSLWRKSFFIMNGFVYSLTRHAGFLMGFALKPREASYYPHPPRILRRGVDIQRISRTAAPRAGAEDSTPRW